MKFSDKFKRNWWYLSLFVVALLLVLRWNSIYSGTATNFDVGLLAVATALVLVPIFSEFTFLGLTFKQEIESAKKEIQQEIKEVQFSLRAEIQNSNNIANSSQQIMYNNPPPDRLLEPLTKQIIAILQETNRSGAVPESKKHDLLLPEQVTIAFSSRYLIEKEIRRIWETSFGKEPPRRGLMQLLSELIRYEIISESLAKSIQNVLSVASPIMHGESYTTEQIEFLFMVAPPLIATLESISIETTK